MTDLWLDIRYAVRTLARARGFSLLALAILGIGLGASTTIFSALNGVLLRPLPYANRDRLVVAWEANRAEPGLRSGVSAAMFESLGAAEDAAWTPFRGAALRPGRRRPTARTARVAPTCFAARSDQGPRVRFGKVRPTSGPGPRRRRPLRALAGSDVQALDQATRGSRVPSVASRADPVRPRSRLAACGTGNPESGQARRGVPGSPALTARAPGRCRWAPDWYAACDWRPGLAGCPDSEVTT
jgi:hypothetical protein